MGWLRLTILYKFAKRHNLNQRESPNNEIIVHNWNV